MPGEVIDQAEPNPHPSVIREQGIESDFVEKLRSLKYTDRPNIRDRTALKANFRQNFEALNRVSLTDGEVARLVDETITPDTYAAARSTPSLATTARR